MSEARFKNWPMLTDESIVIEMYKFLDDLANGRGTDYPIEQLLAKARGEHDTNS